jgi:UDP-N-acetylmuramoyl-tripeptide--D-alanyl-D-alanine ligase
MLSALNTMVHIASTQKAALRIAVLGDMLELGGYATACHRRVGEAAKGVCTHLIVLGEHAREYAGGAIRAGMPKEQVLILSKEASLDNHIKRLYQLVASTSAVVLFKGSHSTPLSAFAQKFIAFLRSIPERKL